MSLKKGERIQWIDCAKGIGSLCVIIGHMEFGALSKWTLLFTMPLFFFINGCLFSSAASFGKFVCKKFRSLLTPYLSLGMIVMGFNILIQVYSGGITLKSIRVMQVFADFFIQRRAYGVIWFLPCLFLINILCYFLVHAFGTGRKLVLISFAFYILGMINYQTAKAILPWNFDIALVAVPYFVVGILYRENSERIETFLENNKRAWIGILFSGCFICTSFGYFSYMLSGENFDMYSIHYGIIPLTFLASWGG